jgi:integrase
VTGWRLGEIVKLKMSQLDPRPDGHAAIKLRAINTKSKYSRMAFLTKEVVDWIDAYHTNGLKNSEWVFPGEAYTTNLADVTAYMAIKALFERAGLNDTKEEIYSPHSFRTFADSQMAKCGLDGKYIAQIIGHKSKLGAESSYKDWETIESEWVEKCSEKMTEL